jgi:hypothetical protein
MKSHRRLDEKITAGLVVGLCGAGADEVEVVVAATVAPSAAVILDDQSPDN